jgi:hypothetical protein
MPGGCRTDYRLLQRDGELATTVTLELGRNTGLTILNDADIQCSHGTPSIEAAAVR